MAATVPHHLFTYGEYLARERETGQKYEFHQGQIFAMAGGTPEHARLISEITYALRGMVDPKICRVFTSELKVRVPMTGLATYPDVAVVCGEAARDAEDPNAVVNPKVLVEVLSASTEAYDRGEKWAHYRTIDSLEAYVLVSQIPQRVEIYERVRPGQDNAGEFLHRVAVRGETLRLPSLGGVVLVEDLYQGAI